MGCGDRKKKLVLGIIWTGPNRGVGVGGGGRIVESFCVSEKAVYFVGKAGYRDA